MPRIVINEYDKTTSGTTPYANFAVVVPGPINVEAGTNGQKTNLSVFDENGIYECDNVDDFLKNIGTRSGDQIILTNAVAPTFEVSPKYLSDFEFYTWQPGSVQTFELTEEEVAANSDATFDLYKAVEYEASDTPVNGHLKDLQYQYVLVEGDDPWDKGGKYTIIKSTNVGVDGVEDVQGTEEDETVNAEAPVCEFAPRVITGKEFFAYKPLAEGASKPDPVYGTLYKCEDYTGQYIGRLHDLSFKYTRVNSTDEFDELAQYAVIEAGDEGVDEAPGYQIGNQIAYELLLMGYPVLYKKYELLEEIKDPTFWSCLKDKATYDFRYLITGLLSANKDADQQIINLANCLNVTELKDQSGRGDCIALVDVDALIYNGKTQDRALADIGDYASGLGANQYSAIFAPTVTYKGVTNENKFFNGNRTFPASFHYLACAALAAENYNEWYAIAGYTRGICKYAIDSVGCKFGETAINALEPRTINDTTSVAINLVAKIKNNYYLWGNRTAKPLNSKDAVEELKATHFLNVRQLCTTLKKQIYVTCRRYTFEPNSDVLWINFCNAIRPTLDQMKADQGISDFKFIKVKSKKKALLTAKIRIVPIEAVEDFFINVYLEDSIAGIDVEVEED